MSISRNFTRIGALWLLVGSVAWIAACDGGDSGNECSSNADCSGRNVCRAGTCVPPDDEPDAEPMDMGADMTADTDDGPDDVGNDAADGNGQDDQLAVETVSLDDGSTALTFGVTAQDRGDDVTDVEVTSDAVYAAVHSEGDPVTQNTIFEDRGYLVKINRSTGEVAWAKPVESAECDTKVYGIEVAGDGTIYTLSDYRKACSEGGANASIAAPLYAAFNGDGSLVDRDRRTDPNFCYRTLDLAPDASSLIVGGQTQCRRDDLAQVPLFARIPNDLSTQSTSELSGNEVGSGWISDVTTLSSGETFGAGYIPPASESDTPQPFFSSLDTDDTTGQTSKYGPAGIDPSGVAANNDTVYISGTSVTGNDQAVLLTAARSDGSYQTPVSLGNSPSRAVDINKGSGGNIWVLSYEVGSQAVRIDELTPGNLSSPSTSTIGFSGTNATTVTPQSFAITSQGTVAVGGTWERSGGDSAQAFIRLPGSGQ